MWYSFNIETSKGTASSMASIGGATIHGVNVELVAFVQNPDESEPVGKVKISFNKLLNTNEPNVYIGIFASTNDEEQMSFGVPHEIAQKAAQAGIDASGRTLQQLCTDEHMLVKQSYEKALFFGNLLSKDESVGQDYEHMKKKLLETNFISSDETIRKEFVEEIEGTIRGLLEIKDLGTTQEISFLSNKQITSGGKKKG